jgi:uracil-DNA glycosylase family 4
MEDKIKRIKNLKEQINSIKNCDLKKNATNLVFADGNPDSSIMIIGEGPGANEDKEGKPFVGRAGKLLDKMLQAIKLNRNNVYISNVVNYRPPQNRRPSDEEINRYLPFLNKHIEIINPKILLLLGSTALNALIGDEVVISKARGKWIKKKIGHVDPNIIVSFHPAYLMRQPDQKKYAWEDLKMIRKKIYELKSK